MQDKIDEHLQGRWIGFDTARILIDHGANPRAADFLYLALTDDVGRTFSREGRYHLVITLLRAGITFMHVRPERTEKLHELMERNRDVKKLFRGFFHTTAMFRKKLNQVRRKKLLLLLNSIILIPVVNTIIVDYCLSKYKTL